MEEGKKKKGFGFMTKLQPKEGSIMGEMQEGQFEDFMSGILDKIKPMAEPLLEGISESMGVPGEESEFMAMLKKDKKSGKLIFYVIRASEVKSFKMTPNAIKHAMEASDFLAKLFSGELKDMFGDEK